MKKVKLFFPNTHKYGDRTFEEGTTHELNEECPGFISRWLNRGCQIVVDKVEDVVETITEEVTPVVEVVEEIVEVKSKKKSKKQE